MITVLQAVTAHRPVVIVLRLDITDSVKAKVREDFVYLLFAGVPPEGFAGCSEHLESRVIQSIDDILEYLCRKGIEAFDSSWMLVEGWCSWCSCGLGLLGSHPV